MTADLHKTGMPGPWQCWLKCSILLCACTAGGCPGSSAYSSGHKVHLHPQKRVPGMRSSKRPRAIPALYSQGMAAPAWPRSDSRCCCWEEISLTSCRRVFWGREGSELAKFGFS